MPNSRLRGEIDKKIKIGRDWCKEQNIQTNYCDPGSPWQNGRIESFNSRLRDELLTREVFDSMREIRFMLEEHRNNYNHYRPHSALSYLTPVEYALNGGPKTVC